MVEIDGDQSGEEAKGGKSDGDEGEYGEEVADEDLDTNIQDKRDAAI